MRRAWPQYMRRALQLGALLFIVYAALGGAWRNHKVAHNSARLVSLIHGDAVGRLYGANERALSVLGEPYAQSKNFLGMTWGSRVAGMDSVDPIMVAAHAAATGSTSTRMLLGLLVPLGLALLLGKVFCSHLCPMRLCFEIGQMVRAGLARLGVHFPELRHRARFGGWVLAGGLIATLAAGTSVWFFILPYLALSTSLFLYVATGVIATVLVVAGVWLFIDIFLAPGYWCHNLCPTGFVLEQAGRLSPIKLRKDGARPCPERCNQCQRACPYGLLPREETHTPACDNCGRCAVACPARKLARRLPRAGRIGLPVIAALLALAALPGAAQAHHNKGLPHYGYFENYPQVPTEEYIVIRGKWEMGASIFNFQGLDRRSADTPNDVKIYAYLYDLQADAPYRGAADFEIRRRGDVVSRFERLEVDTEAVYSTRETLPDSGQYELVAMLADGTEVALAFEVDLASGAINWLLIGAIVLPVGLVFVLAFLGRAQKNRKANRKTNRKTSKNRKANHRPRSALRKGTAAAMLFGVMLATGGAGAAQTGAPSHDHQVHAPASAGEVCPHCGMIDCTMEHVMAVAEDGSAVMIMGGIPIWLFIIGVGAILALSFIGVEWLAPRAGAGFRKNLIADRRLYRMVRSRWFQAVPQLFFVAVLGFLIYVGLFGSRVANLTPVAVWTIWWGGLIFVVLILGSAWCFVCPWDGLANLFSRLRVAARVPPLSLDVRFPGWLRNVYLAIFLFALLTWLELGFGVTTNPRWTAYMGLAMAGMAVMFALLFEGKKFCAHACPVGRICGIYSTFAPIEIRARKPRTCQACKTEDCLNGNERGYPCPTGISLKTVQSSSMCTMCTECVKSCNKQNVAINLRPLAADLGDLKSPRRDEAWLALTLLALTLFHGLTMTPVWEDLRPGRSSVLEWMTLTFSTSKVWSFTLAMIVACSIPVALYWLSCRVAARMAGDGVPARALFVHYAYALLPVALFYHLAHNAMHLLMEGGQVVPLASDPMGVGADYLGTAGVHMGHLVAESTIWYLQVGLILIGHIFGIVIAHRISRKLYARPRAATRSLLPMLAIMIAISVGGLYLMSLDMNMRVGRM
jgi:polyferredoxin